MEQYSVLLLLRRTQESKESSHENKTFPFILLGDLPSFREKIYNCLIVPKTNSFFFSTFSVNYRFPMGQNEAAAVEMVC